jgi:hypothetical protein
VTRPALLARLAVVVAAVASSIWLLPASVHIVAWGPPVRVALLAPLSRLVAALVVSTAAIAVAWRASGRSLDEFAEAALPLGWLLLWVVPFLPWLPDRAPVLIVLAGPLRWAIAAVAIAGAAIALGPTIMRPLAERLIVMGRWNVSGSRRRMTRTIVFAVSFAVYAGLGLQFAREMGFSGDEPHYLIITHSLYADRDLDIANNHAQRDYRSFFPGELRPDSLRRGLRGEIYSIHAPGLPALLLPAYAVGGALGAVVFVAALGALTALAIFDLATALAGGLAGTIAWAATCFTVPFVPHAWLIYPELPGALIVAWAVLWLRQAPVSAGRAAMRGAALALLPWLHTKFVVFVALFASFEVLKILLPRPVPLETARLKRIVALVLPIGLSGCLWLYSFYRMYGEFNPEAPYGSYTQMFVLARNIPRGILGLLFDQKFGILAYSPVYILVVAGAWIMLRDRAERLYAVQLIVTAALFLVATTRLYMWWGGSSAPARFLVPIVPLVAPMIAVAIGRMESLAGRALVISTLVLSFAVAALTIGSPGQELLYSNPHGAAALAKFVEGDAPLDIALPTFTEEDWRPPIGALVPWLVAFGIVGVATTLATRRTRMQPRSVFWTATMAGAGALLIGSLLAGLRTMPGRSAVVVRGQLRLLADYDPSWLRAVDMTHARRMDEREVMAAASLTLRRAPDAVVSNPRVLEGPFDLPEGRYETRIWFDGPRPPEGEAFVGLTDQILLARASGPLTNPVNLPFELPIRTAAFVGVSDAAVARAVRRIDIVPASLLPRSALPSHVVEPTGGAIPSFMAYVDDHTYPEGGVFWTRDTEQGTVVIATAGASTLGLILHVGPAGGPVAVDAGGKRIDVDLAPNETRELTVPLAPGTRKIALSVKASRWFRPAEVDPKSDDQRRLGCQVRPVLS